MALREDSLTIIFIMEQNYTKEMLAQPWKILHNDHILSLS